MVLNPYKVTYFLDVHKSPSRFLFHHLASCSGGCPLVAASVATLGHVRGRDPMDTSSAKQDEVDIGRDGADGVGGTEP